MSTEFDDLFSAWELEHSKITNEDWATNKRTVLDQDGSKTGF